MQAELDAAHVRQALREEAGRDQQQRGQGDLRGGGAGSESGVGAGAGRLAALSLHSSDEVRSRAVKGRKEAKENSRTDGQHRGKHQRDRIEPKMDYVGRLSW